MKLLIISDEEEPALWDYYQPGRLKDYDLILSCGDLKSSYLSFLVTMARCPLLYVHGNHDTSYPKKPPEGCDCIEDQLIEYNGIRILGLGGCRKYRPGDYQHSERQMRRRIRKLRYRLWRAGGVDIVVTHAPPEGVGDGEDRAHWGFHCFRDLLDKYKPMYLFHGHIHLRYNADKTREREYGQTRVINATGRYELEIPDREFPEQRRNQIIWRTKYKYPYEDNNQMYNA